MTLFAIGSTVGGAVTGAVAWSVGACIAYVPEAVRLGGMAVAIVAVVVHESGMDRFRLPQNRRLVPQSVFLRGAAWSSAQFGFELGTGVRTYLPTGAPHLVALGLILLWPSLPVAVGAGAAFGITRTVVPLGWMWRGPRWGDEFTVLKRVVRPIVIFVVALGLAVTATEPHLARFP